MIKIDFPAQPNICIENIVFDFNGTLAISGVIEPNILNALSTLIKQKYVKVYVLTADTYGTVAEQIQDSGVILKIVSKVNGTVDKLNIIKELGNNTVAVGNGKNDTEMLKEATLSICIMGKEGCSIEALLASDIAVKCIEDAINLFNNPLAIKATLRK